MNILMVGITEYSTYMNYTRRETMYKCIWFSARLCIVFEYIAILQHVTVKRHFIWEHGFHDILICVCLYVHCKYLRHCYITYTGHSHYYDQSIQTQSTWLLDHDHQMEFSMSTEPRMLIMTIMIAQLGHQVVLQMGEGMMKTQCCM